MDRATVKRYCKRLDDRGTLKPDKAPGNRSKLDEKASKLLVEDLRRRPWATPSQRAQFLLAVQRGEGERGEDLPGDKAPFAQPKKDPKERQNETST